MRFVTLASSLFACFSLSLAQGLDASNPAALKSSAAQVAASIKALYPNPNSGILPLDHWYWWISGSTLDGLATYFRTTGDATYNTLVANTIFSQATATNDFMTADATGNDDQAWWALAAMSAAEYAIPSPAGAPSWLTLAQNVFNEQKGRWNTAKCNGGLKWKINPNDSGYTYRSTISNGLFFQLAARLARFTGDADALAWAEKAYDWTASVGLIDGSFNVFDGTDDSKGENGCVDVNHDQWSYNVGTFLYGSAVMAAKTGDAKWTTRTQGFLGSIKRNFVKNGNLFESNCEGADGSIGTCNTDQQSFKGAVARWMGATATILPQIAPDVQIVIRSAAGVVGKTWTRSWSSGQQLGALEILDAGLCSGWEGAPQAPGTAKRSIAGRIMF